MKFFSAAMELYLIIWIITPAFGISNECNKSLGLSELDIDRIDIYTDNEKAIEARGNIRLSENWPVFEFSFDESPLIMIDLGEVHNITGILIKGAGESTRELRLFSVIYGISSDHGSLKNYKNEKEEYVSFQEMTKEQNIRYQPFYPSFIAKYFGIYLHPDFNSDYKYHLAMQIDLVGCRLVCDDALNTSPGNIIPGIREAVCFNNHHLEIKFDETGIYQIESVKITITDDIVYKDIEGTEKYLIYYSYDLEKEKKTYDFDISGRSGIFRHFSTPVQSLKLCMYSDFFEGDVKDIYNYITIEVRGCRVECNNSLVSELDVDRIHIYTDEEKAKATIGNIRLSKNWSPFKFNLAHGNPLIMIDLGDIYEITGMIIKGEDGKGTGYLKEFNVAYSNSSSDDSLTFYTNANGEYQTIKGTTKDENIRYQEFIPFLARYFFMEYFLRKGLGDVMAIQIDLLGCNITREITTTTTTTIETTTGPPCSDIINTTRGEIISAEYYEECANNKHLEIKFVENGIYNITSVKVTITGNGVLQREWKWVKFLILYNYNLETDTDKEDTEEEWKYWEEEDIKGETNDLEIDGRSAIFRPINTPVQSLKLCMESRGFEDEYEEENEMYMIDIYKDIIIEVRGCRIGNPPKSSSTE